ncbi:tetratricopeptide repeat-containing sensor histidine kinase [Algoriphagus sp. AGSA1]|uniref:tetratricopeptide repeat-containing sensor histidine kinase n=1 Tax=Algoriphagus sp. AGSA1 TaxID=2907213 RepID=UPI001F1EC300|nr:tetratricopeptide repeat protein [Algoriphagus sp. AGSA1]MCE7053848.1 tetratricopeptide repeat-containing sensor histidine kinase [Algoriphagus sp. AGSA1]
MNPKSYIFLVFIFLAPSGVYAQIPNIDSLKSILPVAEGRERLSILNELATHLREVEQQIALDYALEAEELAISIDSKSGEAIAKENIGWIYYRRGHWQKAFDYSKTAYDLSMEDNNQGQAARVLNSMGALYYEQHSYLLAIEQFRKAFTISEKVGDLGTMIRSLNNIAFNYIQLDELDSAMFYVSEAIEVNKEQGSPYMLSFSNRVVGDIYFKRDQLESAEKTYEIALVQAKAKNLNSFLASVLHRLGNTYLLNDKPEKAKGVLMEGLEVSSENGLLDELAKCHSYLAEYYRQKSDYEQAFSHQSKFVKISDSITNKSSRDRLALMQGMFRDDIERSEYELLLAQNEIQATRLTMNKKIMLLVGIGLALILGLLIRLYFLNRKIRKYNASLILQKQQIHRHNIDLEIKSRELQEINQTKNKLFSIIGHDLRGPVGQVKSIVDLLGSGHLTQEDFNQLIEHLKMDVDTVYFTLNNTLKWSMTQMEGFRIYKVNFTLEELITANIKLISPILKEKSLNITCTGNNSGVQVYADRDLIDIVIRNILNNAVKFSNHGDTIHLSVKKEEDLMVCCVKDQGIGMDQEQINQLLSKEYVFTNSTLGTSAEKGSGLGIQICKEFIRMNGGDLQINSVKGEGTTVCIKLKASQVLVCN